MAKPETPRASAKPAVAAATDTPSSQNKPAATKPTPTTVSAIGGQTSTKPEMAKPAAKPAAAKPVAAKPIAAKPVAAKPAAAKPVAAKPAAAKPVAAKKATKPAVAKATKTAPAAPASPSPFDAVLQAWMIWQGGFGSAADVWAASTAKSLSKSADLSREILAAQNWHEIVQKQHAYTTDALSTLLSDVTKIAKISGETAVEVQKPLSRHKP